VTTWPSSAPDIPPGDGPFDSSSLFLRNTPTSNIVQQKVIRAVIRISTDPAEIDFEWLVPALSERAYWAEGRPRDVIDASIRGSLCFGAYDDAAGGRQVGFARVVTDRATYGWICDVFVDESARGAGVGKALMAAVVADPRLARVRLQLATRDAFGLYAQFGFRPLAHPERLMERPKPV
jgi:GNAT superfamily N-acetyltransferase